MRFHYWLRELRHDVAISLRQLRRSPGFAVVAVITLGLAISATTVVFAVVDSVMLRALPFRSPSDLYLIQRERGAGGPRVEATYPEYRLLRDEARAFAGLAAVPAAMQPATFTDGSASSPVAAVGASGNLFDVLGARAMMGRTLTPDDDRRGAAPVIVLSHALWTRTFGGDPRILGRRVELNSTGFTVVGVMPKGFEYPRGSEAWIGLVPAIDSLVDNRQIAFLNIIGRVRSEVSTTAARDEANRLFGQAATAAGVPTAGRPLPRLTPLRDELLGGARRGMLMLLAAAGLVLLVACANVANLLLARATTREGELAVRTALGASRGRLVRQLLVEASVLSAIGTALGLGACAVGRGALAAFIPADLYRASAVTIDIRVAAFSALLMVVTTLLFGVMPALRGTRLAPGAVLRAASGRATSGGRARRTQRALVALEVALAVMLLISGGVLVRSFSRLNSVPLGFDRTRTLTAELVFPEIEYAEPAKVQTFYRAAIERTRQLPGVSAAGGVLLRPLAGPDGFDYPLTAEGGDASTQRQQPLVNYEAITPGYLQAVGLPVLAGRDIAASDDANAPRVVLVSATTAARFWPNESPVGKRLKWGPPDSPAPWIEVVGVVGAARYRDPRVETLDVYVPYTQSPWTLNHLVLRVAGDPGALAASLRAALADIDPDVRVSHVATVGELAAAALKQPRFQMTLVGAFAIVALLLGAVGIFGVVSFATARRTRELGVRMALGARGADVQRLVVGETLQTVAIGVAIGVAGALSAARLLEALVYGVSVRDPLTYAVVPVVVISVGVLAASIPARRAARVDPAAVLRMD